MLALVLAGCVTMAPPPATPVPTPTPLITPTPEPDPTSQSYRVRSGDTLLSIAQRFGLTIAQLMAANPRISDPNRIQVGQVLVIPPPGAPDEGPRSASFVDGTEDPVDPGGESVSTPGYADITSAKAELVDDRRIRIEVTLVSAPPARMDPAVEAVRYIAVVDVDSDGQPDYRLLYANDVEDESGFVGALLDRRSGRVRAGADFPGQVAVQGRRVVFTVRRPALDSPRLFALAVSVEREFRPGGDDGDPEQEASTDQSPDQQWPRPNARWLEVGGF
ncbi:MAG: LysM peptidoglycan-binding domain-containing protein [Candidatus Limnocylindrales bacterium]